MLIRILIVCCLFFGMWQQGFSRDADSLYRLGMQAAAQGDYHLAILQFERAVFLFPESSLKEKLLMAKAEVQTLNGQYRNSLHTLDRFDAANLSDSAFMVFTYQKAINYYLMQAPDSAASELSTTFQSVEQSMDNPELLSLYAIILNGLERYEEAKALIRALYSTSPGSLQRDSLYQMLIAEYNEGLPSLLSPRRAKFWATILPGSGHVIAGKPVEGLLNLSLQGAAGTAAWILFRQQFYLSAVFIGFSAFRQLHAGGRNRAEYLADESNRQKIRSYNTRLNELIIKLKVMR